MKPFTTIVTRNRRISLGKEVASFLGIDEGDVVKLVEDHGRICIVPMRLERQPGQAGAGSGLPSSDLLIKVES